MKILLYICTCALIFSLPLSSWAAELFFDANEQVVHIRINTEGAVVNAVAGTIIFPSEVLTIQSVSDGNSALNFWVEKPQQHTAGRISFSGITPGGFRSTDALLFSFVVRMKEGSTGELSAQDIQVLRNDGKGSPVPTTVRTLRIPTPSLSGSSTEALHDKFPPEDFHPIIARDANLFEGKYFLVFSTQDKGSGISRYAVREGYWGEYTTAQSPYLLTNQSLQKKIFVQAIDGAGNIRMSSVDPRGWIAHYLFHIIFGIVLVGIVIVLNYLWRKNIS